MKRDLAWGRDQTAFLLDFNDGQADQDFSITRIDHALNEAYDELVNWAKSNASRLFFIQRYTFTWPGTETAIDLSSPTYSALEHLDFFQFYDVTDGETHPRELQLHWRDRNTLVWQSRSGPGTNRTIRALYLAHAEPLVNESDEPTLIHPSHRHIWPLKAAIILREIADEQAPPSWERRLQTKILAWQKELQARPRDNVAGIQHPELYNGLEHSRFSLYDYFRS